MTKPNDNIDDRILKAMQKLDFTNKYDFYEFLSKYGLLQDLEHENEVRRIIKDISNMEVLKRLKIYIRDREKYLKQCKEENK